MTANNCGSIKRDKTLPPRFNDCQKHAVGSLTYNIVIFKRNALNTYSLNAYAYILILI